MSETSVTMVCNLCRHPASGHEANECWVDLATGEESWNPQRQCPCGWYEPIEVRREEATR